MFRHESWFADDVYELLRRHGVALVIGDSPQRPFQALELTADWTFVRFHHGHRGRGGNYSERELRSWAERIDAWRQQVDVYAYFNNDWNGFAPRNARVLKRLLGTTHAPCGRFDRPGGSGENSSVSGLASPTTCPRAAHPSRPARSAGCAATSLPEDPLAWRRRSPRGSAPAPSYAVSTPYAMATRSEVLALRAQLSRIADEIRGATYDLGEAVLRDDQRAIDELRGTVAGLEEHAVYTRAQIDQVQRWANGAVERERVAVQPTRIAAARRSPVQLSYARRMATRDDVMRALTGVIDPELKRPVTELDMVPGIEIEAGASGHDRAHRRRLPAQAQLRATGPGRRAAARRRRLGRAGVRRMSPEEKTALVTHLRGGVERRGISLDPATRVIAVAQRQGRGRQVVAHGQPGGALDALGDRVGILDADVYGHRSRTCSASAAAGRRDKTIVPPVRGDLKLISIGFFLDETRR